MLHLLRLRRCLELIEDFKFLNLNKLCNISIYTHFKIKITRNLCIYRKIYNHKDITNEKITAKTCKFKLCRHVASCPHRSDKRIIYNICWVKLEGFAGTFFNLESLPLLESFSYFHILHSLHKRLHSRLNHIQTNVKFESNNYKNAWKTEQVIEKLIYNGKIKAFQSEIFYIVHLSTPAYFL